MKVCSPSVTGPTRNLFATSFVYGSLEISRFVAPARKFALETAWRRKGYGPKAHKACPWEMAWSRGPFPVLRPSFFVFRGMVSKLSAHPACKELAPNSIRSGMHQNRLISNEEFRSKLQPLEPRKNFAALDQILRFRSIGVGAFPNLPKCGPQN